ncbi:hypothetical protein [Parabacteroides goldsteinii]|uniref:hypothetical protein n=1 Tax=Parabacteroides goldsteinii TaxID=328812 RepID=UPI001F3D2B91|nr:hypothetical protein [Parabacteroides goldsteinii]
MKLFQYIINKKIIVIFSTTITFICAVCIIKNNTDILSYKSDNDNLYKVLKHYKNDKEKYNAALFLIKNMANKYTHKVIIKDLSDTNTHFSLFDKHINKNNYKFILDSLNLHIKTDLMYDTQYIDPQYLIENCNKAFYAWKKLSLV